VIAGIYRFVGVEQGHERESFAVTQVPAPAE